MSNTVTEKRLVELPEGTRAEVQAWLDEVFDDRPDAKLTIVYGYDLAELEVHWTRPMTAAELAKAKRRRESARKAAAARKKKQVERELAELRKLQAKYPKESG